MPQQTTLAQDQAKAANQGKPGYDVLGNPIASTSLTPTISSLYGSISPDDTAINAGTSYYRDLSQAPVDEQSIRAATMQRLQTEIDATNQVYNHKLAQAKIAGEGNLGSNAAISARRG